MRVRIIPIVLLLGGLWAAAQVPFLGTSLLIFTDSLAHAARWVGVTDPGVSWLVLGLLAGALAGVLIGLRRAGRPVSGPATWRSAAVAGAALLVAGSASPPRPAAEAARADRSELARPIAAPRPRTRPRRSAFPAPSPAKPATTSDATPAATPAETYSAGGEVDVRGTVSEGASSATTGGSAVAPAADPAPLAAADRAAVNDVQTRLAAARTAASAGEYAAALRALADADEGVAIASSRFGGQPWVAALRREAAGTRAGVRAACESAAALAAQRGNPAMACD